MKPWLFIIILSTVVMAFFIGRKTKQVEPVEGRIQQITDSLSNFYESQYKTIDSIEIKQVEVKKYRYQTRTYYDTILYYIPYRNLDSMFASYKPL
jgi:F0F1-type ATP synthase membrane subunit a